MEIHGGGDMVDGGISHIRGAIGRRVESIDNSEMAELKWGIFLQKILHLLKSDLRKKIPNFSYWAFT